MPRPRLEFWFDFASTYSYLSAMRIDTAADDAGVDVVWRPFLLGPIFAAQGWHTSPFNLFPAKGQYMWRDMTRLCAARDLPLVQPDPFPQNSLLAARVALAALDHPQGDAFCRAVFSAEFGNGAQISDPDIIAGLLRQCGLPGDLSEAAATPGIKAALRGNVERAIELGIFGAPSFTVGAEVFWGDDRLDAAMAHARG